MKIVVGLGNPGEKYQNTRHNAGFILVEKVVESKDLTWNSDSKFKAEVAKYKSVVVEVLYVKPQTFMNNSGDAVVQIINFYKIKPEDMIVVNDDIDLPFGQIKMQFGAGAAGHHGVESIIQKIGTQSFTRVRVGIGRPENPNIPIDDWVLTDLSETELRELNETAKTLEPDLDIVILKGLNPDMYNKS